MENYRIDSHKLIFHPERVTSWLKGETIYPINAEVGISGACNHRCTFCSVDYMGYSPKFLSKQVCDRTFREMYERGLKSILLAGTGEPLVNKEAVEIINNTKSIGIDMALSTNGVLFTEDVSRECLNSLTWIRFSVSAGTEDTYKKIHRGKDGDLEKAFTNIQIAAEMKKRMNIKTTLGVQIVMVPDNIDEIVLLAKTVKKLGADQFSVKSFGFQPLSNSNLKEEIDRRTFYDYRDCIVKELQDLNDENFVAVYRQNRMNKPKEERPYCECYAMPFHTMIDANGDVWPCCVTIGMKDMCFGNINNQTFTQIWESSERKNAIQILKEMKLKECSPECRLDDMNRYLHELVNPNAHINFI